MIETLLERYRQGDRQALARLLSLVARGENTNEILAKIGPVKKPGRVVAITGSAGVGKSTLIGKLIELLRARGQSVAVLACDPQSPVSGGALLGDRFRMPSRPDDGVFIRSVVAAGGQGAVALHLDVMLCLLERYGFDVIFVETAGAGQTDTTVHDLADVVVLLVQPETGDDLQWEKAGLLEVADIVAIHKADLPGAESAEAQVRDILGLSAGRSVPVLRVSARTGQGIEPLWDAVAGCRLRHHDHATNHHALLRLAQEALAQRFAAAEGSRDQNLSQIIAQWQQGSLTQTEATRSLLVFLAEKQET